MHLRKLHGVIGIALSYVIRSTVAVPSALSPLITLCIWSGTHTSMIEELITYTPHDDPSCDSDNDRVYALLATSLAGTSVISSISRYQSTRNGRKSYLSLVTHNMGSSKWEKTVEIAEGVLNSRVWNEKDSRYSIKIHISRHRYF